MRKITGSGLPGAPWRSHLYRQITTAGFTFTCDTLHLVRAISFFISGTALTAITVSIFAENQLIFSAVPIPCLANPMAANAQAPAAGGVVIWTPLQEIAFGPSWPITITPSATCDVVLQGVESETQGA